MEVNDEESVSDEVPHPAVTSKGAATPGFFLPTV